MKRIIIGVTGASGAVYAARLIALLAPLVDRLLVVPTPTAWKVCDYEMPDHNPLEPMNLPANATLYQSDELFAPPASGSYRHDGMVVIPCSMGSVGKIANGIADNLLCRAADVTLKERRPLIIVPREAPLGIIHLRNLTKLAEAGACIIPACPSFYRHPNSVTEVVDSVVHRVMCQLGVTPPGLPEWGDDI
ncbi:MAG: UbiX family flavin prenyltransferase [Armatimonadota bacterium]